jgi:predicted Zn finger-like uncharacterized protein
MFTRCPECRTVFHISASELRAAEGAVICGACGVTFDALEHLSETRPVDSIPDEDEAEAESGQADEPEVFADRSEEVRDEEEFLEEIELLIREDEAVDVEEIRADAGDSDVIIGEMPADPPEIDVVEAEEAVDDGVGEDGADAGQPGRTGFEASIDEDFEEDLPDPDSVFRVDDIPAELRPEDDEPFVGDRDQLAEAEEEDAEDEPQVPLRTPGEVADYQVEDSEPRLEPQEEFPEFASETPPRAPRLRLWLVLASVLLLAVAWVHSQHGRLLRHPVGQSILAPVYRVLGVEAAPDWSPGDFRALKWEAVANPNRPEELVVAVDFVNGAAFAQPYPVVRVVLEDRFGRRIGRHDFEPEQYLEAFSRGSRLPAGGRVRTTLEVPDPEGRAEGFRVDFCLDLPGRGLVCGPELYR